MEKKIQTFGLSYLRGKFSFQENVSQNYLIFNTNHVSQWISEGLSNKSIRPPDASDNSLAPAINYIDTRI